MDENNFTSSDYTIGGASSTPAEETATTPVVEATTETVEPKTETPAYTLDEPTYSGSNYTAPTYTAPTYTPTDYTETYSSTMSNEPVSTTKATISLVCGILSIILGCCCCGNILFSIPGIICGCLQKPTEDGKKPGSATAGIITSIIGILITILSLIAGFALGLYEEGFDSFY